MLQKLHAFYSIICLGMVWTKMHPILKCVTLETKTSNIIWLVTQFYEAFIELKMLSIQDHQKQYSHIFANMRKNYSFFLAILAICVKKRFLSQINKYAAAKELKAFFAFTESQPTSATLHYQQTNQHGSMEGRPLHLKEEEDHGHLRRFSWRLQFGHKKTLSGLRSG